MTHRPITNQTGLVAHGLASGPWLGSGPGKSGSFRRSPIRFIRYELALHHKAQDQAIGPQTLTHGHNGPKAELSKYERISVNQ
jgi:hypothetical protein